MITTAEKLQIIIDSKAAIKQAIIDKGGEVGDLTTYAQAITNLPSGGGEGGVASERVAYIRRKGDGYIMTGVFGANSDLSISITYSINTFPPGYYSLIYAYKGEAYNATRILINNRNTILGALNSKANDSVAFKTTMVEGVIYTAKIEPSGTSMKLSANGESASKVRASGEPLDRELQIFPTATDNTDICIYHITIYDKDVLVRNFVPYRKNGKFGLWDAVEKKFYASEAGDFSGEVVELPNSGGGDTNPTAEKNDVTFYDYDGTIRYSYTAKEFLALTEMPPLPTQKGLICQEWNWSYEDAIEYVAEYGVLDVGATYITDDGKTRLYIRIAAEGRMDVPLYFQQTVANGVTIDWGDGSATETLGGTGNVNTTHQYASIGDYCITLTVSSGCTLGLGHNAYGYCVMGSTGNNGRVYCNMLQKVEIGAGVTSIDAYAFCYCGSLFSVTIPQGIVSIMRNALSYCYSLQSIVIPNGLTSINLYAFAYSYSLFSVSAPNSIELIENNVFNNCSSLSEFNFPNNIALSYVESGCFQNCYSLSRVLIPNNITSIGYSAFQSCQSLSSIVIPANVTSINYSSFQNCYGSKFYDFSALTSVPKLLNSTNAFQGIPSDCKIVVPDNLYDDWIVATNWSAYASYIIKKTYWDASKNNQ